MQNYGYLDQLRVAISYIAGSVIIWRYSEPGNFESMRDNKQQPG